MFRRATTKSTAPSGKMARRRRCPTPPRSAWPTRSFSSSERTDDHSAVVAAAPLPDALRSDHRVLRLDRVSHAAGQMTTVTRTVRALRAAGDTNPGLKREVNEDRFHCDISRGLFVVI